MAHIALLEARLAGLQGVTPGYTSQQERTEFICHESAEVMRLSQETLLRSRARIERGYGKRRRFALM